VWSVLEQNDKAKSQNDKQDKPKKSAQQCHSPDRLACPEGMVNAVEPFSTSKMLVGRDRLEVYLPRQTSD
jgi:hypothetical protein